MVLTCKAKYQFRFHLSKHTKFQMHAYFEVTLFQVTDRQKKKKIINILNFNNKINF